MGTSWSSTAASSIGSRVPSSFPHSTSDSLQDQFPFSPCEFDRLMAIFEYLPNFEQDNDPLLRGEDLYQTVRLTADLSLINNGPGFRKLLAQLLATNDTSTRSTRCFHFLEQMATLLRPRSSTALVQLLVLCHTNSTHADGTCTTGKDASAKSDVLPMSTLEICQLFIDFGRGILALQHQDPNSISSENILKILDSSLTRRIRQCRRQQAILYGENLSGNRAISGVTLNKFTLEEFQSWMEHEVPMWNNIVSTFCQEWLLVDIERPRSTRSFWNFPQTDSLYQQYFFLLSSISAALQGPYQPLYASSRDGLSFNRLLNGVLGYRGPTLILFEAVTTSSNHRILMGMYTATPWKESNAFYGDSDACLMTLHPQFQVFRPRFTSQNYMYCNPSRRSRGYDGQVHGLGMGGDLSQPRWFLTEGLEGCYAASQDTTFESGPLRLLDEDEDGATTIKTGTVYFEIESMEVWGVGSGGDPAVLEQAMACRAASRVRTQESIQRARQVDKAQFLDDMRSGIIMESKMFQHRQQVDGRANQDDE